MLQVRGVSKAYVDARRSAPVLTDVSLSVAPGERVGLVGRSGAGKSTLAQMMALLMRPDSGSVSIDGSVVRRWGFRLQTQVRQQIQLIWQSPRMSTNPRYTLQQIISEPLHSLEPVQRRQASARLRNVQKRVGLTDELLGRYPHAVSDGQLQRACLIRALLLQPKYLVCDEFTAMLDASTQATLLNAIADEQARTRMGIVLITHDHRLAQHWCHRLVELSDGRLSEIDAKSSEEPNQVATSGPIY